MQVNDEIAALLDKNGYDFDYMIKNDKTGRLFVVKNLGKGTITIFAGKNEQKLKENIEKGGFSNE